MSTHVKKISESEFESTIQNGLTLVDFYADWCGPCRMIAPHLEAVAQEVQGQAVIAKVDIDQSQRVAGNYQVTSIPTLILFRNGKEVRRLVGAHNAKAIKELILSEAT